MTRGSRLSVRVSGRLAALAAGALTIVGVLAGPAWAVDDASIDHSEFTSDSLKLLVSIPGDVDVDYDSVVVNVGGSPVDATAQAATNSDEVKRTTVLAIDTSNSMAGDRIEAAKEAARTYLATVPDNVLVGIVTFDNDVVVRQEPSLDRAASETVIDGLSLKLNTALYAGVRKAIETTGADEGQRQVLVLSDGRDNTDAELDPVIEAISDSGVQVDVVSLEQGADAAGPLQSMADAGRGQVISADTDALTEAFTTEADALARQILVTAVLPDSQTDPEANVEVSIEAGGTEHTGSAFIAVRGAAAPEAPAAPGVIEESSSIPEIPEPALYGALGGIAVGVILLFWVLLSPKKVEAVSLTEQLGVYSASAATAEARQRSRARAATSDAPSLAGQARAAAEKALQNNQGIEASIAGRLDAAGMAIKASEWLLMHAGIAFAAGLFGLLLTQGNPLGAVVFLFLGALGPWLYLSIKRTRRLAAFDEHLADTLQLMSGSLSAGLSLAQSMDTIVREGTEPITSEFKRVIVESRLGVPLEDALDGISVRMESKDFKWVVMAIRIQREVGGNLAELLNTVAATLREREYLRRHVKALSAEGRLSCWILGGLPPVFFLYLVVSQPDYVKPLYTEPIGWVMLVATAVLLSVGIFWMSKVSKVDV